MKLYFHNDKLINVTDNPDSAYLLEAYTDFDGQTVELYEVKSESAGTGKTLREILTDGSDDEFQRAKRAFQIRHWRQTYRYCPCCGKPLTRKKTPQFTMRCEDCSKDYYPRIDPAIIVAIKYKDKLLLAERTGANGPFYSLIAGFVEPGETIEDAVRREVREEVGLELTTLKYIKSEPWAFPSSLMLGFEAEAADDKIKPDGEEIAKADWFARDALPSSLPLKRSIANMLIQRWLNSAIID